MHMHLLCTLTTAALTSGGSAALISGVHLPNLLNLRLRLLHREASRQTAHGFTERMVDETSLGTIPSHPSKSEI